MSKKEKYGVVDVGGGLRGIYGAGIFDYCLYNGIQFDYCIGVSAGSANLASYLVGQRDRNYRFYTEYALRRDYMSTKNMLQTGSYINLEYIFGTLSNHDGEYPLDFGAIMRSPAEFEIVASDCMTGAAHYFDGKKMHQDDYQPIMASSCVPVVNRPYRIDGAGYYDGGITDPIPVQHALMAGCDKVVVILTRPRNFYRKSDNDKRLARVIRKQYPNAAYKLAHRGELYNSQLDLCKKLEREGRVMIIAPETIGGMKTLKKDMDAVGMMYREALHDAEKIGPFLGL